MPPRPQPAARKPPFVVRRDGVRLLVEVDVVHIRNGRPRIEREEYVVTAKRVVDAVDMQERLERWHRVGQPHNGKTWPSFQALHEHADAELDAARAFQRRHRSGAFYRLRGAA